MLKRPFAFTRKGVFYVYGSQKQGVIRLHVVGILVTAYADVNAVYLNAVIGADKNLAHTVNDASLHKIRPFGIDADGDVGRL